MSKRSRSESHGSPERHKFFKKTTPEDVPELYFIFKGEVASIQKYGVFVKIPGSRKQGLVHISQMSHTRVENPADIVDMGEEIYCKVISVEDNKIGLSMKVVHQGSGRDLDPNLVTDSQDAQKRKTSFKRDIPKIELGAILDTVCRKCGCKGHFTKDCFMSPGGKKYDLVAEEDVADIPEPGKTAEKTEKPKKKTDHKNSKKKKKHKHKHHRHRHSSNEESDSSDEKSRKKIKERQKRRRHSDSSVSDRETKRR